MLEGHCSMWRVMASVGVAISIGQCSYLLTRNIQGAQLASDLQQAYNWVQFGNIGDIPGLEEVFKGYSEYFNELTGDWIWNINVLHVSSIVQAALGAFGVVVCLIVMLMIQYPSTRKGLFMYMVYMPLCMITMVACCVWNSMNFSEVNIEYTVNLGLAFVITCFTVFFVAMRYKEMKNPIVFHQGVVYPNQGSFGQVPSITVQKPQNGYDLAY